MAEGVGEVEGVADVDGVGFIEDDLDDVEAEDDVGFVEECEPRHGALGHEILFGVVDGLAGACGLGGLSGFDLDEDEGVLGAVAADEVDFAAVRGAVVSVEDFVFVAFEEAFGDAFAVAAEIDVVSGRASGDGERGEAAPQARKFCGESDTAHGDGA